MDEEWLEQNKGRKDNELIEAAPEIEFQKPSTIEYLIQSDLDQQSQKASRDRDDDDNSSGGVTVTKTAIAGISGYAIGKRLAGL